MVSSTQHHTMQSTRPPFDLSDRTLVAGTSWEQYKDRAMQVGFLQSQTFVSPAHLEFPPR